jgi:hypothetical protein
MQHLQQRMLCAGDWLCFTHVDSREAGPPLAQRSRRHLVVIGVVIHDR